MKNARSIVQEIAREIEVRVNATPFSESFLHHFQNKLREIEDRVALDFSRGIPQEYIVQIKDIFGAELIECLEQGRLGNLVGKNRDKIPRVYKKLASIVLSHIFYKKEAEMSALKNWCLEQIKHELIESQVSHVAELEHVEEEMELFKFLVGIVLDPFESAMKKVMAFLEAKQLEIFLFDEDKFLSAELKIDGQTFTYNKDDEHLHAAPRAVSRLTFQEVQETSLEVPMVVEDVQIGHYKVIRQITENFDKHRWKKRVERITPVLARIIEANRARLRARKVYIDDLTGLYNKRKLNEQMGRMFKQFKKGTKSLFIAMMDIDRFKALNDTYGHPVGDKILKSTAQIIKEEIPYAYRYGGEEFAGVFYGYDGKQTAAILEKLRSRIEQERYIIDDTEYAITISIGYAEFETHMHSVMDAIDRADQALYASKEDGRNRCTYYGDVQDRLSDDAAKLRQKIRKLEETLSSYEQKNKELNEKIKRTAPKNPPGKSAGKKA